MRDDRRISSRHRGVTVAPAEIDEAMAELADHPAVAEVERVPVMRTAALPVVPDDPLWDRQWGSRQVFADQAWTTTTGRSDVTVAVLDTGVDEMPDLVGRLLPGRNIVDGTDEPYDSQGHGTMVATVLAGSGSSLDVAAGIHWAVQNGADIINLSLGATSTIDAVDNAIAAAEAAGVLVVAAAGNSGGIQDEPTPAPIYPTALPTVLSVGGNGPDGRRYYWSNHGPQVDVAAPGCGYGQNRHREGEFCGTSHASPMVAGIAALGMSQTPGLSPRQWRDLLMDTSVPTGDWLVAGRVDALRLIARNDSESPSAHITSPRSGSTVTGQFSVTAEADDDHGVAWVELLAGDEVIGERLVRRPYTWTLWAGALPIGWSDLTVRVGDGNDRFATSVAVQVNVGEDEPPPPPPPPPPTTYSYAEVPGIVPNGPSFAKDISETGAVVGWSRDNITYRSRAFQWKDGAMTDLGAIYEDGSSYATGINNQGDVVGYTHVNRYEPPHAFLYRDGDMTDLGTLGGTRTATSALDINDHGQVVGNSPTTGGDVHAFLWDDGDMTDLGVLGEPGSSSFAYGVNNSSQVVGTLAVDDLGATFYRAFLWDNGTLHDLNDLVPDLPEGVTLGRAFGINDDGEIIVTTCRTPCALPGYQEGTYVLTPQQDPAP